MRIGMKEEVGKLKIAAETWRPERVLAWAFHTFGEAAAISSAFGAEGMVLIDMASRVRRHFRLFTLDTEFLFPETYNLMDRVEEQYIRQHDVPYNALHEQSYPSIGCTHCTRAVRPGEDPRAGRWSGSSKTECGLHIIQPLTVPPEAGA